MNDIADANKEKVYYINLLKNSNVLKSLLLLIRNRVDERKPNLSLSKAVGYTMQIATAGVVSKSDFNYVTDIGELLLGKVKVTLPAFLSAISKDITPTLIIDEANLALTIDDITTS